MRWPRELDYPISLLSDVDNKDVDACAWRINKNKTWSMKTNQDSRNPKETIKPLKNLIA